MWLLHGLGCAGRYVEAAGQGCAAMRRCGGCLARAAAGGGQKNAARRGGGRCRDAGSRSAAGRKACVGSRRGRSQAAARRGRGVERRVRGATVLGAGGLDNRAGPAGHAGGGGCWKRSERGLCVWLLHGLGCAGRYVEAAGQGCAAMRRCGGCLARAAAGGGQKNAARRGGGRCRDAGSRSAAGRKACVGSRRGRSQAAARRGRGVERRVRGATACGAGEGGWQSRQRGGEKPTRDALPPRRTRLSTPHVARRGPPTGEGR